MSATLTYNFSQLVKAMSTARHFSSLSGRYLGVLLMAGALLLSVAKQAQAEQTRLGFSKLLPPKSKFQLPNLGDISIWRNDMQKAKQAYRKGKYRKARKYLHKALKSGNFLAAWYLGHIHRLGLGVPVDHGKAFHFYRTVALEYNDHGLPPRMFLIVLDSLVRVADGYRTGVKSGGIKRDYNRAMRLYTKAATRGHPAAQFGLANMYLKGQAVKPNSKKAVRWIRLAARKRFPPALAQLGELSLQGKYVRKSRVRAVAMYIVATRSGNEALYPQIFDRLDQLARKLSEEEYQLASELAGQWIARNDLHRTRGRVLQRPRSSLSAASNQPPASNVPNSLYRAVGQKIRAFID